MIAHRSKSSLIPYAKIFLRSLYVPILSCMGLIGGEGFDTTEIPIHVLIRCFLVQKLLGINRHVPWPVDWTSHVMCPSKINRGTRFPGLAKGCHIDGRNGIIIGQNVRIGPGVKLISMNHDLCDFDSYQSGTPIVIGDNCWIASDVKVLSQVRLGNHVIVSAGSVVTKSFLEPNQLIGGVPARKLKDILPYKDQ